MRSFSAGSLAGFAATVPMTGVMFGWRRLLPRSEQYELPPKQITVELAERAGVAPELGSAERNAATTINHFAYGTATGAIYGLACQRFVQPGLTSGVLWGLGVWAGSYLGWLPALNMRAAANREPQPRNAMMIAAHVIWGGVLGLLVARLGRRRP